MPGDLISGYIARLPEGPEAARPLYRAGPGRVAGQFYACHLSSVFQPVVARYGELIGHAAYVRCRNGEDLSPWNLFSQAADDEELVQLDRLARTVHTINYFNAVGEAQHLFLPVDGRLLRAVPAEHGKTFERVLASLGLTPRRVVIVLPEWGALPPGLLAQAAANYRLRGYRVAIRHRFADGSAPERDSAWQEMLRYLRPDIVKLRFASAALLCAQIAVVHAVGGTVLVTHLETVEDVSAAGEAGTDWRQGFALGYPAGLDVSPLAAVA